LDVGELEARAAGDAVCQLDVPAVAVCGPFDDGEAFASIFRESRTAVS